MALFRTGIRSSLPEGLRLISGPGCPVCVTPPDMMERAIMLARRPDTTLMCFGDMMRVPGAAHSLESARAACGARVKVMYSPLEGLVRARREPDRKVVLFGVGFETTIPLFGSVMLRAEQEKVGNLFLLCAFKLVPPALEALLASPDLKIDGLLLPGHVSAVIGEEPYRFAAERGRVPGVIAGFEAVDMLEGILALIRMMDEGKPAIVNCYKRVVRPEGNPKARAVIEEVFAPADARWRGLGLLPGSGLVLRERFARFDAGQLIETDPGEIPEPAGCRCGDVIRGACVPSECGLFRQACTPARPVGPCMVSSEGTCAAYYKYGGE